MKIFKTALTVGMAMCAVLSSAQNEGYSWPDIQPPMDLPMYLSGNFGELRSNHFHMGIDIKTQGQVGQKVVAVDDGYVSRIKVSAYGYGKAIYIDHPNGYTTVYGHLLNFEGSIAEKTLNAHYAQRKNSIDIYPEAGELSVKKGELIAISGNTGGSGGPHLHFEIRRTNGQLPMNPLLFNLDIKDNIPPVIKGIRLYPADEISSKSSYTGRAKGFIVQGQNGRYNIRAGQKIAANGTIGIAIHTIDRLNGSNNKCGVQRIRMFVDSVLVYEQETDVLDFTTQRYVNAHMDYGLYMADKMHYHKCFVLPNDQLPFYKDLKDQGYFHVSEDTVHIDLVVEDAYRNASYLSFDILPKVAISNTKKRSNYVKTMTYDVANNFVSDQVKVSIQSKALYQDLDFEYQLLDTLKGALCATHKIHNQWTPLQKKYDLSFKVAEVVTGHEDKMIIARVKGKGRYSNEGGYYKNGWISTRSKNFGKFTVLLDTVAPTIVPINVYSKRSIGKNEPVQFKIKDNLSGIEKISTWINDKWVLMEFDYKRGIAFHRWDELSSSSGHKIIRIKVTDERGNSSTYEVDIILKP